MNCANVIPAVPSAHITSVSWCCTRKFPAVKYLVALDDVERYFGLTIDENEQNHGIG